MAAGLSGAGHSVYSRIMPKIKYDVHPGIAMVKKWTDDLPAKTGRTLEEWAEFVRTQGPAEPKARRTWLKETHGMGTNSAWWIAQYTDDAATWDGDPAIYLKQAANYVEAMFTKGKEWQRPIFEAVYAEVRKLGKDAKVCRCKTMIPFYRRREFAEHQMCVQRTERLRHDCRPFGAPGGVCVVLFQGFRSQSLAPPLAIDYGPFGAENQAGTLQTSAFHQTRAHMVATRICNGEVSSSTSASRTLHHFHSGTSMPVGSNSRIRLVANIAMIPRTNRSSFSKRPRITVNGMSPPAS